MNINVSSNFPINYNQKALQAQKQSVPFKQMEADTFNVSFGSEKKHIPWYRKLFVSSYDIATQTTSD